MDIEKLTKILKNLSWYMDTDTERTVYLLTPVEKQALRELLQHVEKQVTTK